MNFKKLLLLEDNKLNWKLSFLLMLIAFVFSMAIRYIWIYDFSGVSEFNWHGQLMINTNDGYAYAEGARDMLQGFHQKHDLSYYGTSLSTLTYLLAKILPISFETLILWMPAVFGSLLVVPIMLIARALKQEYMGFIAALLGGIVWSYYNRTMAGYYDTDMLTIVTPTFVLWSLIYNIVYEKNRYLLYIPFFMILSLWWYAQSYSLMMSMIIVMAIYTFIFERDKIFFYKILIFMLIAIASIFLWLKIILFIGLFLFFHLKQETLSKKTLVLILTVVFAIVLFTGGFNPIIAQLKGYIFRDAIASEWDNLHLHYFAVVKTVREAGQIPFEVFADRISGNPTIFILSVIGYILLSIRYRVMWLALPLVGLGFLALKGGLRFTVYAVPPMALGIAYLIMLISKFFNTFIFKEKTLKIFKVGFITFATILILYPNIKHVIGYKVPTVFNKQEVSVLNSLHKIASREDYVVTWWDYGYPIRYYSDVKTLIDGGKHSGKNNFSVAYALTHDQVSGANISRLDVEYTEKSYKEHFNSNLVEILKNYKEPSINVFLEKIKSKSFVLPKKSRDVYLYLPDRLMNILPTVDLFSNINLLTGQEKRRPFFYIARNFKQVGNVLNLGGIKIFLNSGSIQIGKQMVKINHFDTTEYDKKGLLHTNIRQLDSSAPINVIYMKNYHRFLVLDNRLYNSTYIQLYVLENYDRDLYKPVILTPLAKVYKLKR